MLYFLYPLAIVLILLGLFGRFFDHARRVYQWTMLFTWLAALLELARVMDLQNVMALAEKVLPLYSYGLGWVVPAAVGLLTGLLLERRSLR